MPHAPTQRVARRQMVPSRRAQGNCLTRSIDWSLPGPSIDGVLTNGPLSDTFKLLELMTSMHTYGKVGDTPSTPPVHYKHTITSTTR